MSGDRTARIRRVVAAGAPLRVRITVAAVLVVGLAMAAGAMVLVGLVRSSLVDTDRSTAESRADAVASLLTAAPETGVVSLSEFDDDDDFIQVLAPDGSVVDSTENVAGEAPVLAPGKGDDYDGEVIDLPFESERFVVATKSVRGADGKRTVISGTSVSSATEATDTLTRLLLMGVPILALFVGGTTWYLVGRALAPVDRIRRTADEITGTALHRRLPEPARQDEIGRLAHTMNLMLDRLDRAQQRQRRFVSDAAHELRSPVASIKQNAEVAKSYPTHLDSNELADIVLVESSRLEGLVAALLGLARLDEEASPGLFPPVDLDDLVFAEAHRLRQTTSLNIDLAGVSAGRVHGDQAALVQVLRNLIDNAQRHARSTIGLSLHEESDGVVLTVDDDGPGIAPEDRERVFERFVRLDAARARDDGGSGLGLAIVHDIVAAHGGTVSATQSPLGGARLVVGFPGTAEAG